MTVPRAALAAALVAAIVFLPSLRNRFALDDSPIIENNPAAQSVGGALRAFDEPYWPARHMAGLWRPVTILSFGVDWQLSGGSTVMLHATNVALHAGATALLVPVLAAYVAVPAALAGAVLFAVHPVHVEAVANLVGRGELLVALFLFAALLAGRAIRARRAGGASTLALEAALLGAVALALLSKEHAVVAIALLWLDDVALRHPGTPGIPPRTYAAVAALSVAWFLAHRAVEGNLAFAATAPTLRGLDTVGRVSTMLPVVFTVVRLLVWPFDLSPDYHPHVLGRLTRPTLLGAGGLVLACALLALALACWRRHRPVAVGLLVIAVAWSPTSNFLFPTGIVLAERTLYLPSAGLALVAAVLWDLLAARTPARARALVALAVLVPFSWRSLTQIPVWRSTRDLVVNALFNHPESYRVHQTAARVYARMDDYRSALRSYRLAAELFDLDPYNLAEAGEAAIREGHPREALRYLEQAERLDAGYAPTLQWTAAALLGVGADSAALGYARRAVAQAPTEPEAARMLAASFVALREPDSAVAVWPAFEERGGSPFERWLLAATTWVAVGRPDSGRVALDRARARLPDDSIARRRLEWAEAIVGAPPDR
jgi:tetratricopeptide (TPR) repeat protein